MNDYTKTLKIKDNVNLHDLLDLGFELVDYSHGEVGYRWKGIQYEIKDYYPLEDDGTRYTDNYGNNYRTIISIDANSRNIWIEIFNNDCSYHNEGDEVNFIANVIIALKERDFIE